MVVGICLTTHATSSYTNNNSYLKSLLNETNASSNGTVPLWDTTAKKKHTHTTNNTTTTTKNKAIKHNHEMFSRVQALAPVARKSQYALTRTFVSRTAFRAGGGHDAHDDHEHHDHPVTTTFSSPFCFSINIWAHPQMFETLPFNKWTIGTIVWGSLIGGVGIIVGACSHQNKKHGFTK